LKILASGFAYTYRVILRILFTGLVLASGSFAADKPLAPAFRWSQGASGCTTERAPDGHYYYHLLTAEYDLSLAVDPQELEKISRRATPTLSMFVEVKNKGKGQLEVLQNRFTLEFVKHFHLIQSSSDPAAMLSHLQQTIENASDEVRHEVKKHPDQKEQKETELQARLKDYTEMMDFISTRALRPTVLDSSKSSASGWVFFDVKSRWIGPWKKPEEFILRMPVAARIIEFPFSLPPESGKVELRHRSEP
jgi:hypothetical protein